MNDICIEQIYMSLEIFLLKCPGKRFLGKSYTANFCSAVLLLLKTYTDSFCNSVLSLLQICIASFSSAVLLLAQRRLFPVMFTDS
jgi:hypothetical protein